VKNHLLAIGIMQRGNGGRLEHPGRMSNSQTIEMSGARSRS
jgi:hypothetical protein